MAKKIEARFASMTEFAAALDGYLQTTLPPSMVKSAPGERSAPDFVGPERSGADPDAPLGHSR